MQLVNVVQETLSYLLGRVRMGELDEVAKLSEAIHHYQNSGKAMRGW